MLTDEELVQVSKFELEPSPEDVAQMAVELLEFREKDAADKRAFVLERYFGKE